jgi:hypothetical protein
VVDGQGLRGVEIVQDKAAARRRAQRIEQGLCPEHGTRPGPGGRCLDCVLDDTARTPALVPAQLEPEGPPRGSCGGCGARIFIVGRVLEDGLCKVCQEEAAVLGDVVPASTASTGEETCSGRNGTALCGRKPLPYRSVCARHRVQELAGEVA